MQTFIATLLRRGRSMAAVKRWSCSVASGTMGRCAIILMLVTAVPAAALQAAYPQAPTSSVRDERFGISVTDPYRPLEELSSDATRRWVAEERSLTARHVNGLPARKLIRDDMARMMLHERFGVPKLFGRRYFFRARLNGDDADQLYASADPSAKPVRVFPAGTLSAPIADYSVSDDGSYVAYTTSIEGDTAREWRVWDVHAGQNLVVGVRRSRFSGVTWRGNLGFFYARTMPADDTAASSGKSHQAVFFHALGTGEAEADSLVYEQPDRTDFVYDTVVSGDGRYVIVVASSGSSSARFLYVKPIDDPSGPAVELAGDGKTSYTVVGSQESVVWLVTDDRSPNRRVVAVDIRRPHDVRGIVPEGLDAIRSVTLLEGMLLVTYLHDAHSALRRFRLDGTAERDVPLPGVGTIDDIWVSRNGADIYYSYSAFGTPPSVFRYHVASNQAQIVLPHREDSAPEFKTKQVFVTAHDGVRVPMFLSYRRDLRPSSVSPVLLTTYGGFGVSMTPSYSEGYAEWMRLGGILAVANVRGGGEYGASWHRAGAGLNKPTTFSDFVSCAEWLIRNGYTSAPKLAAAGISNGALVAANAIVLHPRLFGAALLIDGVLDMLRYDVFPVGRAWHAEYGSPDDEREFKSLRSYSPLHNIAPGTSYPATFLLAAEHDPRVFPAHSYKFAAALQAAQTGLAPVLIAISAGTTHGPASGQAEFADQVSDSYAFLLDALHVTGH